MGAQILDRLFNRRPGPCAAKNASSVSISAATARSNERPAFAQIERQAMWAQNLFQCLHVLRSPVFYLTYSSGSFHARQIISARSSRGIKLYPLVVDN